MARAIVRALLRAYPGRQPTTLCLGVQANTLGIVTSGQGAAYDEFVEAVRQELKSVPGLKIQLVGLDAGPATLPLPGDTFMVLAVGLQTTPHRGPGTGRCALAAIERHGAPGLLRGIESAPAQCAAALRHLHRPAPAAPGGADPRPAARRPQRGPGGGTDHQRDLDAIRALATAKGLALVTEKAARDTELYPALQSVLRSSDVLLALPDPYVINVSTAQNLLLTAFRFRCRSSATRPPTITPGRWPRPAAHRARSGRRRPRWRASCGAAGPAHAPLSAQLQHRCCR